MTVRYYDEDSDRYIEVQVVWNGAIARRTGVNPNGTHAYDRSFQQRPHNSCRVPAQAVTRVVE